ncbi:unnamed protein product [Adineta steineri]|uniref:Uncharacterized protein n=1 Tax=Adineta steineri TaxID=433720 RepID=A0A814D8V1_9BILA|nr:unnamed protein product [Adineta steineri]CAF0956062.1 unnamed protein product [Adineta steineri]CAF0961070.1 unnamed protein product [Adineta steineri]
MKIMIIILHILVLVQDYSAQYDDDDDQSILLTKIVETSTTINSLNLILQTTNESIIEENTTNIVESTNEVNNISTILTTEDNQWSSVFSSTFVSNNFDLTTFENKIIYQKQQWLNINENSSIFWRKINDDSTYIIRSEGHCLEQMCSIKLKYNGSLSNTIDGCLSFILWTYGKPVGQLWIEEDEKQESFSQKIQLTNSSLRVEHSLRSKIKNLSIDARILFRNSQIDAITLSNLNITWNGSCQKYSSITSSTSTSENPVEILTSTDYSIIFSSENENISETSILSTIELTTIKLNEKKISYSFINQMNIGWFLFLIIFFCLLIIILSFIYGIWSIQKHYRYIWYIPYDYPIQFLSRTSVRSSTRSQNKIQTLAQITSQIFQEKYFDTSTTHSNRSTTSSTFYTYF